MAERTKTIGRMPTDHGPYNPQLAYGKKFIVTLFDCGWESKHDNNTSAPATLNAQAGTITENTTDWKKKWGSYKQWLIDNGYQKMDASNVKDGNKNQNTINSETNTRLQSLESSVGSGGSVDLRIAAAKSEIKGNATSACDTLGEAEGLINGLAGRVSINETDIANLQQLYNNLQQSKPVPVTELPSSGQQQGVIYRLAGTTSYSDYMWNGSTWVLMATYNNAIDDVPTDGSDNLVKSGGVAKQIGLLKFEEGLSSISILDKLGEPMPGFYQYGKPISISQSGGVRYAPLDLSRYIGGKITISFTTVNTTSVRACAIANINGIISQFTTEERIYNYGQAEFDITEEFCYLYISTDTEPYTTDLSIELAFDETLRDTVNSINRKIDGSYKDLLIDKTSSDGYYIYSDGVISETSSNGYKYDPINLSSYIGKTIKISFNSSNTASTRVCAICDNNGITRDYYYEKDIAVSSGVFFDVTDDYHYLYISYSDEATNISAVLYTNNGDNLNIDLLNSKVSSLEKDIKVIYVSPDGNDKKMGTIDAPKKTINEALASGANVVLLKEGVYEMDAVNLNLCKHSSLKIATAEYQSKVIIKPNAGDYVISNADGTLVSGTTKVYMLQFQSAPTINNNLNTFIVQENVDDVNTLISVGERHPLQKGREYRLENTLIKKCTSTSSADAVNEIESSDIYKFYYDENTLTLYYSRPESVSSSHKLCVGKELRLFFGNTTRRDISLEVVGIDVWYMGINVTYLTLPRVSNCCVKYATCSGGFEWDESQGAVLDKCEAAAIQYGLNGDGFNAGIPADAGDIYSHKNIAMIIDCWSHDNNDDGLSCHQKCETQIFGGLFEYCGKGGVTPAYGDRTQIYNAISRKNKYGFLYTGSLDPSVIGQYGQVILFTCVAKNNTIAGFACDSYSKMIAVDCKSIGNATGYLCEGLEMELIDCGSLNDNTIKTGSGQFNIQVTTIVTE